MTNNISVEQNDDEFNQNLQIANEDWPLLSDLKQNRFLLKKKKDKVNISNEIVKRSTQEDTDIKVSTQEDEELISKYVAQDKLKQVEVFVPEKVMVRSIPEVVAVEPIAPVVAKKIFLQEPSVFSNISQSKNTILKMFALGLTKLYVKKTTTVLNPVKFVAENAKKVIIALIHLGIPVLMSWYLITKINFIALQLSKEGLFMFLAYCLVFYFASLFVWVTTQVVAAGIWSMFKTAAVDIQKAAENKVD